MQLAPWHQKPWGLLTHAKEQNRLPHALLLIGDEDSGLKLFADAFAHLLLCKQGTACGVCHSCQLVSAKSHSDFIVIEPEESGQMIKIDQIRPVVELASTTSMHGGYRVILIRPAEAMNIAAQNALLKTLEEPTPNTLLLLLSDQSRRLLKTITSRCQRIVLQRPSATSETIYSERYAFYQELIDLACGKKDPLKCAAEWEDKDLLHFFKLLLTFLQDCLRRVVLGKQADFINHDYAIAISSFQLRRDSLLRYIDLVRERFSKIMQLQNLNRQLLLEELLIEWIKTHDPC